MMTKISDIDYSHLDRPEILQFLFHPRPECGAPPDNGQLEQLMIPVEKQVLIGARAYISEKTSANILFFHGNGEIVEDYHDLGLVYVQSGVNFIPVDYRGYGRSNGRPTVTAMMQDARIIFDYIRQWLRQRRFTGPFIVMGRSLGSAPALELAANYSEVMDALIVESGFAHTGHLLDLLGIGVKGTERGLNNLGKIRTFTKPTLIIHAEYDHIIPFSDGRDLFEASPAEDKQLLMIPGANHNDIFARGMTEYLAAVNSLIKRLT